MKKIKLLIVILILMASGFMLTAQAGYDYERIYLPNNTTKTNPQPFYCTAKPKQTENPRILMANRAQFVTGFKSSDPNSRGQLIIYADQLNRVYFEAYQDPQEPLTRGYVQAVGTGEVYITCHLGKGSGRTLMPGDYGLTKQNRTAR